MYNAKNSWLKAILNKKLLSLFLNRFRLEIDLIVDGRRFQSLGAAQLNDLSSKVIFFLTFGVANKIPESWLRLKSYLDEGRTDIDWRK